MCACMFVLICVNVCVWYLNTSTEAKFGNSPPLNLAKIAILGILLICVSFALMLQYIKMHRKKFYKSDQAQQRSANIVKSFLSFSFFLSLSQIAISKHIQIEIDISVSKKENTNWKWRLFIK